MDDNIFLDTLPHEIWVLILNQLKNTQDQSNAAKCTLLFRDILLKERVKFLFQNVLNIIVLVKLESSIGPGNRTTLTSRIQQKDIKDCRRVCSSWNTSVENLYEKPAFAGVFPFVEKENKYRRFLNPNESSNPYIFTVAQPFQAQLFVSEYVLEMVAYKNPFLGRFIVINVGFNNRININVFTNALTTILETFGEEIWYTIINIKYSRFSTATEDYLKLRELLAYMPNLKSLRLNFRTYCAIEQETLRNSPLPDLNKLFHLGLSNVGISVLNEMFRKYNHVSYLQINNCGPIKEWSPVVFTGLKGLYLDAHCQICCDEVLHWFGNEINLENLLVYNRKPELRFCKQFEIIKRYWSDSLTALTLKVEGNGLETFKCPKNLHLKLLHLNRLTIYSYRNLNIDFVQTLKNLECLEVSIYLDDSDCDLSSRLYKERLIAEQRIEFVGFETRMQASNIWKILKKLKRVSVKITKRQPILCYEYLRNKFGTVTISSFFVDLGPKIQLPDTHEYVFGNLQY